MIFMHLSVWALLLLPVAVHAQDSTKTASALGFIHETTGGAANNWSPQMNTIGVQYRRNFKPHKSFEVIAGYTDYRQSNKSGYQLIKGDSVFTSHFREHLQMVVAGFGVEVDRRFYRKVHFFAGIEARAGFGSGTTDTSITRLFNYTQVNPSTGLLDKYVGETENSYSGPSEQMFYMALTPYVGAKLEFKRISVGLSLMNSITYRGINVTGESSQAMIDFDISNLTKRFSIAYKF